MNITSIFDRIRHRKRVEILPIHSQYVELLKKLASGDEVEVEELEPVLDGLAIDEKKLSDDVSKMQKRMAAHAALARCQAAQRDLAESTAELSRLQAEYDSFISTWQPKARAARDRQRAAETAVSSFAGARATLCETVFDQSLLSKENELIARRRKLLDQRRELADGLSTSRGSPGGALRSAQVDASNAELAIERERYPHEQARLREIQSDAQARVKQYEPIVAHIENQITKIDAQMADIASELSSIEQMKLEL